MAVGIIRFNKSSKHLQIIIAAICLSLIADLSSLVLIRYSVSTWWIFNVYFILQCLLLYRFFFLTNPNKALEIIAYLFLLFALINFIFIQKPFIFNSYTNYTGAIILLIFSLHNLNCLLRDLPDEKIYRIPSLWISFGILVYYGGTLFLFLFNNFLLTYYLNDLRSIWILHNVLNVIKNLLFAVALWQPYRQKM
jgi:hypothetical protein